MKQFICTVCPRGCHLSVDEDNDYKVSGNSCPRGEKYGKSEAINPVRTLTSTIRIAGASLKRCPVRTKEAISKALLFEAMKQINAVTVSAPLRRGDVIIQNLAGSGVDLIATRDIAANNETA